MKLRKVPSRSRSARAISGSSNHKSKKIARKRQESKCRKCVCMPQNISPVEFPSIWTEFRVNNQLCDGVVKCEDGKEFRIHRAILSAVSPYFKVNYSGTVRALCDTGSLFRPYLRIPSIEANRKTSKLT